MSIIDDAACRVGSAEKRVGVEDIPAVSTANKYCEIT